MARDDLAGAAVSGGGTGVAGADGRLLWVDDSFCAILGRSRDTLVSARLDDVLGLDPGDVDGWETGAGMVRLPSEAGSPAYRLSILAVPGSGPWGTIVELEGGGETPGPGPSGRPAVFALHRRGTLAAMWGGTREVLGLTPGALGRRLTSLVREDPLMAALIRRTLRGESTAGLFVGEHSSRQVHLLPVTDPDEGTPGVLGVAWLAGLQGNRHEVRGRVERDAALGELALMALRSVQAEPLLEAAATLIQRALDAESCAVSEYLPGGGGLHVRAAVGLPPSAPRVLAGPGMSSGITVAATAGLEEASDGSLEVPIGGPPAVGRLAVKLQGRRTFTAEDKGFVLAAAEVVTAALGRLAADEQIRRAALHDPLTGLPLRTLVHDHLRQALARSRRHGSRVGLLFVDLDGFQTVKDTLGRGAGDELLVAVARRLLTALRPSDMLGHLGSDEFMVVCEDLGGTDDARIIAGRLSASFQEPFHLSVSDVSVSASVGVSLAGDAADPAVLLSGKPRADTGPGR
ncbi:MAG: diguanylate cyclase domain-containing protein [Acidimicrobiia bacterium]